MHQVRDAKQGRSKADRDGDESARAENDRRSGPGDGDGGLDDAQRDAEGVDEVTGQFARVR
jgi:hypothetical protein